MSETDAINAAYWLQGFVELQGSKPTDEQWKKICDKFNPSILSGYSPYTLTTNPLTEGYIC